MPFPNLFSLFVSDISIISDSAFDCDEYELLPRKRRNKCRFSIMRLGVFACGNDIDGRWCETPRNLQICFAFFVRHFHHLQICVFVRRMRVAAAESAGNSVVLRFLVCALMCGATVMMDCCLRNHGIFPRVFVF